MDNNKYVLIMAGGIGSRFWPMSRKKLPKQFLDILNTGSTLFQDTYLRACKICPEENIFVVINESYRDIVKQQVPNIKEKQILGEPQLRNTAPCVAYGAFKIGKLNNDAVIAVVPSDHIILDEDIFLNAMEKAFSFCSKHDALLTLGIKPTRPDTGYGYIQMQDDEELDGMYKVKTFTEKPNLELAQHFVQSEEFLWNSGIFIWSAKMIKEELKEHLPEIHDHFKKIDKFYFSEEEKSQIEKVYSLCNSISIDYGLLEKTNSMYVLPVSFRWSDIGTWNALYEFSQKDEMHNVVKGDMVILRETTRCIVNVPNKKLVVLNGVEDLIVVEDNEILLIGNRNQEQEVRQIVNEIKIRYGEKYI